MWSYGSASLGHRGFGANCSNIACFGEPRPECHQDRRAAGADGSACGFRQETEARLRSVARSASSEPAASRSAVKTYKVELVTYDYQSDGKRAGELAEKLITDDKVNFMTAPFGSGHTKVTAVGGRALRRSDHRLRVIRAGARPRLQEPVRDALAIDRSDRCDARQVQVCQRRTLQKIAILGRDDVFPKLMADLMKTGGREERA